MNRFIGTLAAAVIAVATLSAPADAGCGTCDKTIVENAVNLDGFNTLVAAVKAADLAETLSGDGPFTVFAPTDEAFDALPEGTLETLLKPENKEKLASILKYHVVPGSVKASQVVTMDEADTVQGQPVKIMVDGGTVKVNDAKVVKTDVASSNGIIHVIDKVILPPSE